MSQKNLFGTACKTCRRRGRKCDRRLPTCVNCGLRGVECEGYVLRWVNAAVGRQHAAGRALGTCDHETIVPITQDLCHRRKARTTKARKVATPAHSRRQMRSTSNTLPHSHVVRANGPVVQDAKPRGFCVRQRQVGINPIARVTAHDDLGDLVKYYAHEINAAFSFGNRPLKTPCRHHILPFTRAVPSIRCAVAATAASHLANRLEDHQMRGQSLHLRLKATELLRAELGNVPGAPDLARLLCMLLLAQLDVCSGDCVEFGIHLKAARAFISLYNFDDTERSFIEQRLAWLDVMEATTTPRMPHSASEDFKRILNKFTAPSGERMWGLDVFPCPIDLFEYLAEVLVVHGSQPQFQQPSEAAIRRATAIGNAVQNWSASVDSEYRRHLNEAWRNGILLYLIRLFRIPDDVFNTTHLRDSIFYHARSLPSKSSWGYSTSWPLFQAGLCLPHEDSETKTWLRNELYKNFNTLGCCHQKLAVDALEQAWWSGRDSFIGPLDKELGMRRLILY